MKIYTHLEVVWDGSAYVTVREESFDCPENGIALCKGASSDQTNIAQNQSKFYDTLRGDYAQQFGNQTHILSALDNALSPTVAAGPSQFGFSKGQTDALNSQAIQGTGLSYQHAQRALQNHQAAEGGGNMYLPSGVNDQNNEALAASGAAQTSDQLLNIQNEGYQQGNRNYNNAVNALGGVAAQYNPVGYGGLTDNSGNAAAASAAEVQKANTAASPWGAIGGLLGGAAGAFAGPMGAAVGSKLGSKIGGAASGMGGGDD